MQIETLEQQTRFCAWKSWDLGARLKLMQVATKVVEDAEGFTLLMHAQLYLTNRAAYQANRFGVLQQYEQEVECFRLGKALG